MGLWKIMNFMHLFEKSDFSMSIALIVCPRSEELNAIKATVFKVSCFKVKFLAGCQEINRSRTVWTFQKVTYLVVRGLCL